MKQTLTALLLVLSFWAQAQETIRWTSPERYNLSAELYPAGPRAVIFIHGTGGPDQRGPMWARELNRRGITVLAVDFRTGIYTNGYDRGRHQFIPMLRSAIDQLKSRGHTRIGVMGTSLGGVIAIRSKMLASGVDAQAYAALYPNCSLYQEGGFWPNSYREPVQPGPIMILYGEQDDIPDRTTCPQLEAKTSHWNAQYIVYGPARHGWDRQASPVTVPEPTSPSGSLTLEYHPAATRDSLERVTEFFDRNL